MGNFWPVVVCALTIITIDIAMFMYRSCKGVKHLSKKHLKDFKDSNERAKPIQISCGTVYICGDVGQHPTSVSVTRKIV